MLPKAKRRRRSTATDSTTQCGGLSFRLRQLHSNLRVRSSGSMFPAQLARTGKYTMVFGLPTITLFPPRLRFLSRDDKKNQADAFATEIEFAPPVAIPCS